MAEKKMNNFCLLAWNVAGAAGTTCNHQRRVLCGNTTTWQPETDTCTITPACGLFIRLNTATITGSRWMSDSTVTNWVTKRGTHSPTRFSASSEGSPSKSAGTVAGSSSVLKLSSLQQAGTGRGGHQCHLSASLHPSPTVLPPFPHSYTPHTHTLSLSLSHVLTLSLTHTHTLSLSLSHTHTHTLSLSCTHTHTLSVCLSACLSLSHTHTHTPCYTFRLSQPMGNDPLQIPDMVVTGWSSPAVSLITLYSSSGGYIQ